METRTVFSTWTFCTSGWEQVYIQQLQQLFWNAHGKVKSFCGVFIRFSRIFHGFSNFYRSIYNCVISKSIDSRDISNHILNGVFPLWVSSSSASAELWQDVPRNDRLGTGDGDEGSQSQVGEGALGLSPGVELYGFPRNFCGEEFRPFHSHGVPPKSMVYDGKSQRKPWLVPANPGASYEFSLQPILGG